MTNPLPSYPNPAPAGTPGPAPARWEPCPAQGPGGVKCELRGKGHTSPHTWEECQATGPNGEGCYEVEPIGPPGHPRPSRAGHDGPHSWETRVAAPAPARRPRRKKARRV